MERITTKYKRKAPLSHLQRRVRARRDEPEEIPSNESQSEEGSEDEGSEGQSEEDLEQDDEESDSASEDDEEEVNDPSAAVSQISFGALAKAQASLPDARRGKGRKAQESDEESESENSDQPDPKRQQDKRHLNPAHRTSKHAPAEQSSKRPVSRKREVVAVRKPAARDPRFSSAVSARPLDESKSRRAYEFLDRYREDEMAQLRTVLKQTRHDERARDELRRALESMQGRKRAQQQRDKERAVLEGHRRQEKELVKQGKQPFYLKKSEQKKRLLVDRFAGLKKKQVDRVIERRRKKLAARERRDAPMPAPRRETS